MKDFNHLKSLWSEQKSDDLPDVNKILEKAKKTQRFINNKIRNQVIILTLVVIFMLVLMKFIPFKEATTFIAIGMMSFAIVLFSTLRMLQFYKLQKIDLTKNPRLVLIDLENYYQFQQKVNTNYTVYYFILMNIAFALYFIEVLKPISLLYKVIIVVIYLSWMLIAFLYLGKKHKRKEQAKTQTIIDVIRDLEKNYED